MFRRLKSLAAKAQSLVMRSGQSLPAHRTLEQQLVEFAQAYGQAVLDKALSEEAKQIRTAMISGTLPVTPDMRWELTDIYPYWPTDGTPVGNGPPEWIEKYAVHGESTEIRSTFVRLVDDELQMVHLAPGQTLASPLLQADAMNILVPLALVEKSGMCQQDYAFDEQLIARGLPDIWPDSCAATLMGTGVTRHPDSGANWSERWAFWVADGLVGFDVDFTAAPDGGTFITARAVTLN
jgi:hypothetical protein